MSKEDFKIAEILLVEDNEGDIVLTQEAFNECKIKSEISIARNGKEALEYLFKRGAYSKVNTPDLILLDINIPIYSGLEVLSQIKSDSELRKIPVIILTTSSNQKDIDAAYASHCNSYVEKPLHIKDFLSAILKIDEFWLHLTTLPK
jgi:CheY-like chemotaxis protein